MSAALWLIVLFGLATLLASACGPNNAGQSTPAPTEVPPAPIASPPAAAPALAAPSPSTEAGSSPDAQQAIDAAMRDASGRLGTSDLHVDQAEARQWPDASLGCPRQGVMYAQIVTPGFLVVISGAGKQLEYHADSRGRVVLCEER